LLSALTVLAEALGFLSLPLAMLTFPLLGWLEGMLDTAEGRL
jgi:hypothetical protein